MPCNPCNEMAEVTDHCVRMADIRLKSLNIRFEPTLADDARCPNYGNKQPSVATATITLCIDNDATRFISI